MVWLKITFRYVQEDKKYKKYPDMSKLEDFVRYLQIILSKKALTIWFDIFPTLDYYHIFEGFNINFMLNTFLL